MGWDYVTVASNWNPWAGIPERYNLGVALTRGQVDAGRGDVPAVLWENAAGERRAISYRELDALTSRLASSLARLGIQRGDRVFLRLPNIPEFFIAALAIAKLGGVFIPSSIQFRMPEVEYRLRDAGVVAAITTAALADVVEQASATCPEFKHLILIDGSAGESHLSFSKLIDEGIETFVPADTRHDDVAFIAYTSGTTGDPKGVVHFHRYPIAYESLVRYWQDYRSGDIVACPSELGWMLPLSSTFLYAMSRGLTVVLYDAMGGRFEPAKWRELFQRYRITNFTAPPTMYRMMMADSAGPIDGECASWRHASSAGEPLPADTLSAMARQYGVTPFDGIGMTECMVYCFNTIGMPVRAGSCGRPGPGTVIELMDERMQPVGNNEEGVLCVRRDSHPGMMKEFWNKPRQTAECFRGEWYYSGDVLVRDDDGYFWFKGRNDDVIGTSGYRISPFEVESGVVSHPAVLEAAAVESPDAVRGNVVKAFVILRPGFDPCDALVLDIQQHVKLSIAPYKYPRKIEFVATLPKTTSGKIKRRELRERERTA